MADASVALSRFSRVQAKILSVKRVPQQGVRQATKLLLQATSTKSSAASQALQLHTMMQLLKSMNDQVAARQQQAAEQSRGGRPRAAGARQRDFAARRGTDCGATRAGRLLLIASLLRAPRLSRARSSQSYSRSYRG